MKFYQDPATRVAIFKPPTNFLSIQMPVPAALEILAALRRMESIFSVRERPAVRAFHAGLEELLRAEETPGDRIERKRQLLDNTQRLDPAFAGPAPEVQRRAVQDEEESFPIRAVFPDYGQPVFGRESYVAPIIEPTEKDPAVTNCIDNGPHEQGLHIPGCPDGD